MATKRDVLTAVREDLIHRIGGMEPGIEPQFPWHPYEGNEPKEEDEGGYRSFTIDVESEEGVAFGSTVNDYEIRYRLEVTYGLGQIWTDAAADDYDNLTSALQRTWTLSSLPAGLDFYEIGEMAITEDDFFQTATIIIIARVVADVRS
jgi:hypothetical protein